MREFRVSGRSVFWWVERSGILQNTVDRVNARIDPELAQVIEAWHTLPPDTRTAILAIVEAAHRR